MYHHKNLQFYQQCNFSLFAPSRCCWWTQPNALLRWTLPQHAGSDLLQWPRNERSNHRYHGHINQGGLYEGVHWYVSGCPDSGRDGSTDAWGQALSIMEGCAKHTHILGCQGEPVDRSREEEFLRGPGGRNLSYWKGAREGENVFIHV